MLISELPIFMIRCLIITIFVELFVGYTIGIRDKKDLLNILLVNIFTNPLVTSLTTFFNLYYGYTGRIAAIIILELFAIVFEGFVYFKYFDYRKINGFLISLILNFSSYIVGEIINNLL